MGLGGELELEGESVSLAMLEERLKAAVAAAPVQVGIRADQNTLYQSVVQVLGVVKQSGVSQVTLLTRPESEAP